MPFRAVSGRARGWVFPIEVYPVVYPLAIVLLVWAYAEVNVLELVRPVVVTVLISLSVMVALSLLAGDRRIGGIAATAALVALIADQPTASVLLVVVAIVVALIGRLPGAHELRSLALATKVMRTVAVVIFVASLLAAAGRPGFTLTIQEAFLAPPGPRDPPAPALGAPDIFVYLLDGYPGRTAASRAPWFDPEVFPAALRERGFTVHIDARTNYLLTQLVLPTMFEGRHLSDIDALAAPFGPDRAADARRLRSVSEHADGIAAIRAAGYDVVWVSSGYSHLDIRNVDRWIEAPGPTELEVVILRSTGAGNLLEAVDQNGFGRVMRDRITSAFDQATSIAGEQHVRPRFVFVHVPAPHPPTVFRADGSAANDSPDAAWDQRRGFNETSDLRRGRTLAQVEAIGDLTLDAVDAVQAASSEPPVIVLFSDHGTDIGWDPVDPLEADLAERTSTILATRTPGHPDLFAEPTTPINIIGMIANTYLGTDLQRQPDVSYAYDGSVLNVVPIETSPGD